MKTPLKQRIADVLTSTLNGRPVDFETASELAHAEGSDLWDLFAAAGRVREQFRGSMVDV